MLCNARTRSGARCRNPALPGHFRCYKHGARGGRPVGTRLQTRHIAAMVEGRRRWIERMRAAKARGELARLPGGRRSRGLPKLSRDKKIRRAQRILEKKMAARKKAAVSAVAKRQWQE